MTRQFKVIRMKNGRGESNLLAIIEEGIADIYIGTALLIPSVSGIKDPSSVLLETDEKGVPLRNNNVAIVKEYFF